MFTPPFGFFGGNWESKFQSSTLHLYISPRVTSPRPHLMCLAPSQHYSREGLLTQSGLARRAGQVESSENRPQKKEKGTNQTEEKELPSQAQVEVLLQLQLRIMLPLFTTQSDISNNHVRAS